MMELVYDEVQKREKMLISWFSKNKKQIKRQKYRI